MRHVSYSLNLLFAEEEALCCEANTRKAPEIVQVNLNSYTVGDNYCRQILVKGGMSKR
jgi:hypothetical protein